MKESISSTFSFHYLNKKAKGMLTFLKISIWGLYTKCKFGVRNQKQTLGKSVPLIVSDVT